MGQRARNNTRDFFSLGWLLDPGASDRRNAASAQQRATDMWTGSTRYLPHESALFNREDAYGQAVLGGPASQVNALSGDAGYQQGGAAQLRALQQMQGIADGGGYTTLERDQIRQAQQQAAQYEQSQRAAQVQQMQMRGMGGGGAELAARLQAQQSGANQAQGAATDVATAAQMRALQAMQGGAQIGSNVQNQAQSRASAVDAFNQANTNRAQQVASENQQNAQQVASRNAAGRTSATQQAFTNRTNLLAGATGQYNANSANSTAEANRQAGLVSGLIGSLIS